MKRFLRQECLSATLGGAQEGKGQVAEDEEKVERTK